jgi:hypothetical protein
MSYSERAHLPLTAPCTGRSTDLSLGAKRPCSVIVAPRWTGRYTCSHHRARWSRPSDSDAQTE